MQNTAISPQTGRIALRDGATCGILLGIIHSVIVIILQLTTSPSANSNLSALQVALYLLTPLIWVVGFLLVGALAANPTGKVSTGTLAGVFAGTFGGIIGALGQIVAAVISVNQATSVNAGPDFSSSLLFSNFFIIVYVIALALGAGAGFGALGGLIGHTASKVHPQPQPIAVQPAYPPATAFPYPYTPQQQVPAFVPPVQSAAPQPVSENANFQ